MCDPLVGHEINFVSHNEHFLRQNIQCQSALHKSFARVVHIARNTKVSYNL